MTAVKRPSPPPFPRSAGVLLHPTSLPGPHGVGDLGPGARAFVDWLHAAKLTLWQVLPLVPPEPGGSPYASASAFAGNPVLLDLEALRADGLLDPSDLVGGPFALDRFDIGAVGAFKQARINKAARALLSTPKGRADVEAFGTAHAWAADWALFVVLKRRFGGRAFWEWDAPLVRREAAALAAARAAHQGEIDVVIAEQLLFERQWQALKRYANDKGVRIMGDIPIYVAADSVDVWVNPQFFQLDAGLKPRVVSGVPPDAFTADGQLWGNPLYNWQALAADGHRFWVERMRRVLSLTDLVRIDHFRAFAAYWEVQATAKDARGGRWVEGPGQAVFKDLEAALGPLPVILEDLGVIDEPVRVLSKALGLPGMRVLQFAFGDDASNPYLPHNYEPNTVVYTGTHDNDTTLGWWKSIGDAERDRVRRTLGVSGQDIVWDLIRAAFSSVAHTAVVPMQDVLALDGGARMNTPGLAQGNWSWRVRVEAFHHSLSDRLRDLATLYGRDRRA